jgi:hypothetical protein
MNAEARIEALERTHRQHRIVITLLAVVCVALLVNAFLKRNLSEEERYLIANQLKPVAEEAGRDAGQNIAAVISNQIATDIMDQTIRDVAHAATEGLILDTVYCKWLEIVDKDGKPLVAAGTDERGNGFIRIAAQNSDGGASLEIDEEDRGFLETLDSKGKPAQTIR